MAFEEDIVRLRLDGDTVPIAVDYEVHAGVLTIPAAFSMTVGHGGLVAELAANYPPETPFELEINGTVFARGETDGYSLAGQSASVIAIKGRDILRRIVKKQIRSERSFAEKSFIDLTRLALEDVGLGDREIRTDNIANRKAITGTQKIKVPPKPDPTQEQPKTFEETETEAPGEPAPPKTRTVHKTIKAEVGTTWWEFLAEQYRRAGLFLWSTADGNFVLARPNGNQAPLYRILRRRDGSGEPGKVTVLGLPSFANDTTNRYSECQVVGRGGGGKQGRARVSATHFDDEMIALLNPLEADRADGGKRQEPMIIRDDKVRTKAQAAFLARRKVAEWRRSSWALSYTVAGHTAPAIGGGRAIWAPDTVVEVIDDELGIEGPMYVESVVYRRKPETTTEIKLMRCEDLIFAEEDFDTVQRLRPKRGVTSVRVGKTELWRIHPDKSGLAPNRTVIGNPILAERQVVSERVDEEVSFFPRRR